MGAPQLLRIRADATLATPSPPAHIPVPWCRVNPIQLGFKHQVDHNSMLYPGYVPAAGQNVRILHYGLPFEVWNWKWGKPSFHDSTVVDVCNSLFDAPPPPSEVSTVQYCILYTVYFILSTVYCIPRLKRQSIIQHTMVWNRVQPPGRGASRGVTAAPLWVEKGWGFVTKSVSMWTHGRRLQ